MTNLVEIKLGLMKDRAVIAKMKEIEERHEMAKCLRKIDGYDYERRVIEFMAVLNRLVQAVALRDEAMWNMAGATFLIFVKRWPDLYGIEPIEISPHGPN
jgi:hypothetical protein